MEIGTAIKAIRKEKGLSQKQLADKCDISVTALVQIESNASMPKKSTFKAICQELDVSESYILFRSLNEEDVAPDMRAIFSSLGPTLKLMFERK